MTVWNVKVSTEFVVSDEEFPTERDVEMEAYRYTKELCERAILNGAGGIDVEIEELPMGG